MTSTWRCDNKRMRIWLGSNSSQFMQLEFAVCISHRPSIHDAVLIEYRALVTRAQDIICFGTSVALRLYVLEVSNYRNLYQTTYINLP